MNARTARGADRPEADETPPLPDFCNLGVVLRVLCAVNLVILFASVAGAPSLGAALARFIDIAAVVELASLASLALLCATRVPLSRHGARWRHFVAPAMVAVVAGGVDAVVSRLTSGAPAEPVAFSSVGAGLTGAALAWAVMVYFELRARAFSPALAAARLQALQSRIRPHFLFNSLNAAIALVRTDPLRAELVLEDLSDLFRMVMKDARAMITLDEEIKLARQYLAIENLRLGDRLQVGWQLVRVPPHVKVPPLMLQPLLENAIRHGVEPNEGPGSIDVRITGMARELVIVVENSYRPQEVAPGNQLALQNIRDRLALIYDLEASVKAAGDGRLYRVSIRLPLNDEAKA